MLPILLSYASVMPALTPSSSTDSNAHFVARKASYPSDAAVFEELVFLSFAHEFFDRPLNSCVLRLDPNPCDALYPRRFCKVCAVSGVVPVDARERLPAPAHDHRAHDNRAAIIAFDLDPRDTDHKRAYTIYAFESFHISPALHAVPLGGYDGV
jgi:hypothetical protein